MNKNEIEWISVPEGEFLMGSPKTELERDDNETIHKVKLDAFMISKYPVTFELFDFFCQEIGFEKPSDEGWGRGNRPVINVSWEDAIAFAEWIDCRLPTEAEWEYACRAGTNTPFNIGDNITTSSANYNGKYPYNNGKIVKESFKTSPVNSFPPNNWGIFDMHGNVWEWCCDFYGDYKKTSKPNPKGPKSGTGRVMRGGSWQFDAGCCRSACRNNASWDFKGNDVGFRLVSSKEKFIYDNGVKWK